MINIDKLKQKAKQIRLDSLDLSIKHNNGHLASAYSIVEILTVLYYAEMNHDFDEFILSKGHGCLSLFAVLQDLGFNPEIAGHPDYDPEEGIVCTSGSLGHGLPLGCGKAMANRIKNSKGRVFVIVGDGECQEGSIWETLNITRRFNVNNLVTIVDHNKLQALDTVKNILAEDNLKAKFEAFGAEVIEVDGHNMDELLTAFTQINRASNQQTNKSTNKPYVILAHTVKSKGVSFMENIAGWHVRMMTEAEQNQAREEIMQSNC